MEKLNFEFMGKLSSVKPLNDKMTLCKCFILALGRNANGSEIHGDAVERALPSLYNIPVVGHLFINEEGEVTMGGHDMEIHSDTDGTRHIKSVTVPYGTVPMQDKVHFETIIEDGESKDYLVAEVILWTGRFPEILGAVIDNDVYFKQSMEIIPTRYHKENNYQVIDDFEFSALCLLGGNVAPCFKSARIEPYKFSDENKDFVLLFSEMKDEIAKCFFVNEQEEKRGGGKPLLTKDAIESIMSKYGLSDESVFTITEDTTAEEFEEMVKGYVSAMNEEQTPGQEMQSDGSTGDMFMNSQKNETSVKDETETHEELFQADLTAKEISQKMGEELEKATYNDAETYIWYTLTDWSDEYIYAHKYYDAMDPSKRTNGFVRLPYAVDADNNLVIDFTKEESVRLVWLTKADEAKLANNDSEFESLKAYKAAREADDLAKEKAKILAEFTDLEGIEAFRELVGHLEELDTTILTEKCYALRGQYMSKPAEDIKIQSYKIPVSAAVKEINEVDAFMKRNLNKK